MKLLKLINPVLTLAVVALLSSCASLQNDALEDARSCYEKGKYESALVHIVEAGFYGDVPKEKQPQFLMLKGACLVKTGQIELAQATFQEIVDKYPTSPGVPMAQKNLQIIADVEKNSHPEK